MNRDPSRLGPVLYLISNPLVVTGIALDKVAIVHPTPEYPRTALATGLEGKVRIKMTVRDGSIVE
jgi:hypothetical protein